SGAGGSGVVGSAGSPADGAGDSTPTPITPIKSGNSYRFTFGDVVLEIDQMVSGRVGKLALGGADLIMTSATDPTTWGSVFWTSPRADWTSTTNDWPPPTAIDNAVYSGSLSGTH